MVLRKSTIRLTVKEATVFNKRYPDTCFRVGNALDSKTKEVTKHTSSGSCTACGLTMPNQIGSRLNGTEDAEDKK